MGTIRWMTIASVAVGLTILGCLAVAVPRQLWVSDSTVAAALLLFTFVALPVFGASRARDSTADVETLWTVGPVAALFVLSLAVSLSSLTFALSGAHSTAWVLNIVFVGVVAAGFAGVRGGSKIVVEAAASTTSATGDARTQWTAVLKRCLVGVENAEARGLLEGLTERVRFAANDNGPRVSSENEAISELIGGLERVAESPSELRRLVLSTERLIEQREQTIRATRSRA